MGLDMHLNGKLYFYESKIPDSIVVTYPSLNGFELREMTFQVGYWRKANAIHRWFVENVQNNVDDCGTYDVSLTQLSELLTIVDMVLEDHSKAETLLPSMGGFFFGTTNYDEHYFRDLKYTKELLEDIVNKPDMHKCYLTYQSSW